MNTTTIPATPIRADAPACRCEAQTQRGQRCRLPVAFRLANNRGVCQRHWQEASHLSTPLRLIPLPH